MLEEWLRRSLAVFFIISFCKKLRPCQDAFQRPGRAVLCFSVLVEIRQNIFRLCGQSIGTGGGQLCFAPEAPENAQSGQTGIVSRKDVYVAVAHERVLCGSAPRSAIRE